MKTALLVGAVTPISLAPRTALLQFSRDAQHQSLTGSQALVLRISAELQQSCASCLSSCRVAFVGTGTPYALVFAFVAYHYQGHDMTSCCWLVVMGSERFASPIMGIFCGGLNAYCMRIWPLFLRHCLRFVWCQDEGSFA